MIVCQGSCGMHPPQRICEERLVFTNRAPAPKLMCACHRSCHWVPIIPNCLISPAAASGHQFCSNPIRRPSCLVVRSLGGCLPFGFDKVRRLYPISPKRKYPFQNPFVSYHDCWREGCRSKHKKHRHPKTTMKNAAETCKYS